MAASLVDAEKNTPLRLSGHQNRVRPNWYLALVQSASLSDGQLSGWGRSDGSALRTVGRGTDFNGQKTLAEGVIEKTTIRPSLGGILKLLTSIRWKINGGSLTLAEVGNYDCQGERGLWMPTRLRALTHRPAWSPRLLWVLGECL